MDLFKKLREWAGLDKPQQPNFKAQELSRQTKVASTMPKVLSQQGQQDWMKKNAPLVTPKVAKPITVTPPSLQMPVVGGAPKPQTPQQPQIKPTPQVTQQKPTIPTQKPVQQPVQQPKPTVAPPTIKTDMLNIPGQPKLPDFNAQRANATKNIQIEKDSKRAEGMKILNATAPGASMVSTAKRGDTKSVALGGKSLNSLVQEFNNADADGQRTIRKTIEAQRDFHSSARSNTGRQILKEADDALKVLDLVGNKKGASFVSMAKDVGQFGKDLAVETVTAGKHLANPIAAPILYERERQRLVKGEIDDDSFNRNVKRITDNSDSYWRLGYDKNGYATLLDPTKKDDGSKRDIVEGTVAFGRDFADAGVAVGTTVVPFAAPARITGLGVKQAAKELAKEGAAYQAVDTVNEMAQGRNPLDPTFLASSLIPNIGLPLVSQGARALRNNPGRANEATPNVNREPSVAPEKVSREVPQTPADRAAAVEQGIITPETKNLSLAERVTTAINHKAMLGGPSAAVDPTQFNAASSPEVPDWGEVMAERAGATPFDDPAYVDINNPDRIPEVSLDELQAQQYFDNQEFNPDGTPAAAYRIDNIDQQVQEVVELAQARGITDPEMLDNLRAQSRAFFGDERVNLPEELRGANDETLLGRFQDGEIDVRAGQADPNGTYFHEALHRALAEYTTMPERRALYDDIRQKYGDDALLAEAQEKGYSRGLFEAIEERMADDFMEFAANRSSSASLSTRAKAIFSDILERIKAAFGKGDVSSQFMRDLYGGRFADRVKNSDAETGPSAEQLELDEQYKSLQTRYDATTDQRMKGYINQALAANRTERRRVEQDSRYRIDEEVLDGLNPTGGLFVDYNPSARVKSQMTDNITTLNKTMGGSPDDLITIYRGAPAGQAGINPGDFVTTMRELAESYTGDGNVLEMRVRKGDVLDDLNEPLGDEYIYRPNADKETRLNLTGSESRYRKDNETTSDDGAWTKDQKAKARKDLVDAIEDSNLSKAERKALRDEVDSIIYERSPELMQSPDYDRPQLGEGDSNIPRIHVNDLKRYFGRTEDIPARYKKTTGDEDIDLLAQRAGFDDVDSFIEAVQSKLQARSSGRENAQILAAARRDPELLAEARSRIAGKTEPVVAPEVPRQARMTEAEYDGLIDDAFRKNEGVKLEEGRAEAQKKFEAQENNPVEQKKRERETQLRKVNEAIERGFKNGPRHTIEKIIDTAAELGFVPRKRVEEMVQKYAKDNKYDISTGRAHKTIVEEVRSLADEDGLIKTVDEIQPSDKVLGRIRKPGVKHALPYNESQPGDVARQMVYKNEDGTHGTYFEYKTPDGKWQKSGLDAVSVKSPQSGVKLEKIKSNAEINAEAKRVYEDGTTAQYIWRENDAGVNSEFIREFDAAMGDSSKLDKIDSNKIVGFDPDKHYIEAGKVVDASTGKILGNYIEITPEGVNMFAGRQRISLNYNELDLTTIREMKTNGITWTTEGIIDRITGNRKHSNSVDYFKSGGSKTKEALMSVMVEEPRAAQRNIMDEDNALGAAINSWEKDFHKAVKRPKRADARRDAVYVIEPAAKRAEGEAKTTIEQRLEEFANNYGQKAADHLKQYDQFMRGVYDNLLVRMNKERLAIGQTEIKRRANYITHIAEMADGGILRQSIQGINNIIGGDVMVDSRGALPSSITGTTGSRKPKSKYNPFSSERLADNKPLNPFDPLRVYSNLALQNIHMTKPITMNRSIETTVRGLSEAKQEMSSSRGIEYINELIDDVMDKSRNGKATPEDYTTLSRKLFGATRVYQNIEGVQGFQRILRKAAKENEVIEPDQMLDADSATTFENTATLIRDQLGKLADDVDSLNNLKKEADGLQQFVGIIQEHTNKLAGKTNWMIRGLKDLEKGKGTDLGLLIAKGFQQHAALTSIVGNASSTLAQLMATPLVMGTTRGKYQLEGLKLMNDKDLMKKSDAMWVRYKESALAQKTKFQKTMSVGGLPLLTVERAVMKWTFGSKYAEAIGRGLNERQAIKYAERFIGDTTSWRDVASAPRAYDRPLPASLLQFTREVTQQYRGFWNRFTPAEKAKTLIAIAVVTNGMALITGNKSGADPIGAAIETGWDIAGMNDAERDEEENTPWAKALRAGKNALSEVVSAVPIASAAANTIWSKDDREKIFGEDSSLGKYEGNMAMFTALGNFVRGSNNLMSGNVDQAWKDFVKTLPMGSQLQKSAAGLQAMFRGYTTTTTGKVKSSVDQSNPANWLLGGIFGVNAIPDNRGAVADNSAMSDKQSEWFKKLQADGKPDAAKKYADALRSEADKQKDSKATVTDSADISYDDESLKKFAEGKWKQVDGKVVDEDGEIARDFYKGRAKTRKDENSNEAYEDFAIGYDLEKTAEVSNTGNAALDKMKNLENSKKANDKAKTAVGLYSNSKDEYEDIPDWVKDTFYTKAGFTKKDVEYATSTGYSVDAKMDGYFRPLAEAGDRTKLLDELYAGRVKGINGDYFATSTVIEQLYDEGYLSKEERKSLKETNLDKSGKAIASKNGGGSGSKKEFTSADISKLVNGGSDTYSSMASILRATRANADTPGSKKVASRSVQIRGLRAIVKSRKQSTKLRRLA